MMNQFIVMLLISSYNFQSTNVKGLTLISNVKKEQISDAAIFAETLFFKILIDISLFLYLLHNGYVWYQNK